MILDVFLHEVSKSEASGSDFKSYKAHGPASNHIVDLAKGSTCSKNQLDS